MMVKNTSEACETEQLTAPGGGKTDQPKDQRRRKGTRGSGFFFCCSRGGDYAFKKVEQIQCRGKDLESLERSELFVQGGKLPERSELCLSAPSIFFAQTRTRHRSDSFPFPRAHEKRIGGESKEKSTTVACQKSHRNFDVLCNRGHTEAEVDKALPSAKSRVKFTRRALLRIAPRDNGSSSETPMAVPEGWDSNSPTLAQSDLI